MNRYLPFFFILFFFHTSSFAQVPSVAIGTGKSCAGKEVLLGVTASDLLNIGSITLYVQVDTNRLTFLSLENVDPRLSEYYFNFIQAESKVAFVWNNSVSLNFSQTKFFDLRFLVKESTVPVSFSSGCEIATSSYKVLSVNWVNGGILPGSPVISSQPKNVTVGSERNSSMEVLSSDAERYQWEVNQGGATWQLLQDDIHFSGTTTALLLLNKVPLAMNKDKFRCFLTSGDCTTISDIATLTVESSSSIDEGDNLNFQMRVHPNPFLEQAQIEYTIPGEGKVHIRVFTMLGKQLLDLRDSFQTKGQYSIPISRNNLPKGIYLCIMDFNDGLKIRSIGEKIIRN